MEVKPGYKQTEVGVIPEDWEFRCLGELGKLEMGKGLLKGEISSFGSLPAIPYTSLYTEFSEVISLSFVKWFVESKAATYVVSEPCVLMASSSNVAANTGKASAYTKNIPIAVGREVIVFKTKQDVRYISYLLSSPRYRQRTLELAKGITIKHVYPTTFSKYPIALPSESEQCAIAAALSDMDALLDGLDRLIAKKRAIKQATMQQLLTGQTRLPGFSGEWEVKRLGDLVTIKKGQLITEKTLVPGDVPVIAGGKQPAYFHVKANRYGKTITVSASGASAGYVAFYPFPIFASDCSTIGESDSYSIEFMFYALLHRQDAIYAAQTGGAQPHVQPKDMEPISVSVPSDLAEQTAIAIVFSDMDAEITALETRRTKTRTLKQAMMQELLTGRTRLVEPDAKQPIEKEVAQAEGRKANVHFLRSVLAAEIIDQLYDQPTFGHVKFEKMMFLVEHLCDVDTGSTYHRKAAGPYDNRALRSIDSQLQKQQWFEARKEDGRYRYVPMAKHGGHKQYFERHFSGIGKTFGKILATFKTAKTEQCEIVATLLAAWSDLLREKGTVSDEMIVHEVLNNWHESKQRIPEDRWLAALGWMREKGFVPKGVTLP